MAERGRGAIINVTSQLSEVAQPHCAPYLASKGGGKLLTKAMAVDLARSGVRVNALAPGLTNTNLSPERPRKAAATWPRRAGTFRWAGRRSRRRWSERPSTLLPRRRATSPVPPWWWTAVTSQSESASLAGTPRSPPLPPGASLHPNAGRISGTAPHADTSHHPLGCARNFEGPGNEQRRSMKMSEQDRIGRLLREGHISRREFMARAAALGVGAAVPALFGQAAHAEEPKKGGRLAHGRHRRVHPATPWIPPSRSPSCRRSSRMGRP